MTVKTAVLRGKAPPKGIVRLPKDPKKHQESILVFADSERAAAALQAGATYAGGQEMIDKVYFIYHIVPCLYHHLTMQYLY